MSLAAVCSPIPLASDDQATVIAAISRAGLFAALPREAVLDLADRVSVRRVRARAILASQGEPGDSMFLVASGRVKTIVYGESRGVTLAVHGPGEIFGEASLCDQSLRSASCVAVETSVLLVLPRIELQRHVLLHPRTSLALLEHTSRRLNQADAFGAELALCDVHQRLLRRLVSLVREDDLESAEGMMVRRRPTQQELANTIGACRESVSRAFNKLARDGSIIVRGRSLVVTHALLIRAGYFASPARRVESTPV
jgi:CRP/FNR family cyclic AMP-dependent transcriptional regulator